MEIFLLICTGIITLLLLFINIYLLAVYVHPDDRGFGASVFPKILVVLGLTLSWGQVLMLPLDVANSSGSGAGLNMDLFWQITVGMTVIVLVMLIPFAYSLYETDESKSLRQRVAVSVLYTVFICAGFGVGFYLTYLMFNVAEIPLQLQVLPTSVLQTPNTLLNMEEIQQFNPTTTNYTVDISVSLSVYAMALFSFLGWVLVIFFGGMGLFSLPMEYINQYRNKPVKRTQKEINQKKQELQQQIDSLIQMGQGIEESKKEVEASRGFISKRRAQTKVNKGINKFKASVMSLESILTYQRTLKDSLLK